MTDVAASPATPRRFSIASLKQRSKGSASAEIERICSIPPWEQLTEEDIDQFTKHYIRPKYQKIIRLKVEQASALCAWNDFGGLFGPIAVGAGKTLITLLIAFDTYATILKDNMKKKARRTPRILLLIPSQVVAQLKGTDISWARKVSIFQMPVHFVSGVPKTQRIRLAKSQVRGLYIMSYEILSRDGAEELLRWIDPDTVILDEAHMVMGKGHSGRKMKFREFVNNHAPQVAALSGTMTSKELMDYFEIARATLGKRNFMPNSASMSRVWSALLDSNAGALCSFAPDGMTGAGPLQPLFDWSRQWFPQEAIEDSLVGYRRALRLKMRATPGVVASAEQSLGVGLRITNVPPAETDSRPGYDEMQRLVRKAVDDEETPSGDPIDHAMHVWKWRYELEGCGFYNELYWPELDILARRHSLNDADAGDLLERSKRYLEEKQDYDRVLSKWVKNHARDGLYTPRQIGNNMFHNQERDVGEDLYKMWKKRKDADFDERIDRDSRAVRVCDYKIHACVEWVREQRRKNSDEPLFIWYHNEDGVGRWLIESLKEAGFDPVFCPAGKKSSELMNKWYESDRDSGKSSMAGRECVASMDSHGTGKNLQYTFGKAYFLQWIRSAKKAEQVIGRQHRQGQPRDEVDVYTNQACEFDRVTFAATLNDSAYISQTSILQRLMYAHYTDVPKSVSYPVLAEWGINAKSLDERGAQILEGTTG